MKTAAAPVRPLGRTPDITVRSLQELRETEERLRSLTELSSDYYWETDAAHRLVRTEHGRHHRPVNAKGRSFGHRRWDLPSVFPDAAGWAAHRERLERHEPFRDFEFARLDDYGDERWLSISGEPMFDDAGRFTGYRGVGKDVTERKRDEKLLNLEHTVTRCLAEAIDAPAGLQAVLRAVCEANGWECGRYFHKDEDAVFRFAEAWHLPGEALERFIAYSREKSFPRGVGIVGIAGAGETLWTSDIGADPRMMSRAMVDDHGMRGALMFPVLSEGGVIGVLSFTSREIRKPDDRLLRATRVLGSLVGQFLRRKLGEEVLRESEARFRQTFELAGSGMAHVSLDGRFLRVNRRLSEILGRGEGELVGRSVKEISHPDDRDVTDSQRARVRSGELEVAHFEKRYLRADGRTVWVDLAVAQARSGDGTPLYEIAVFDDITERKHAEAALHAAHEELKRSNAELEQFAYVASHDLQEPLRMVSSYTQLIQRRYGDRLDGDAKEFMHYVVDGAARMKQLIEDLLAYSRVGTKGKQFRDIELEAALKRAVTNLRAAIQESGASVTWDPLPQVMADDGQLAQLFQNLIGNALKFRGAAVPRVHVSASEKENEWEISVRDNGIGIDARHAERIFQIFQRLHERGKYPGTGIGLATCQKVVEGYGGRIWVESRLGYGSTFFFTLPAAD